MTLASAMNQFRMEQLQMDKLQMTTTGHVAQLCLANIIVSTNLFHQAYTERDNQYKGYCGM
jgi:hypothetical protein